MPGETIKGPFGDEREQRINDAKSAIIGFLRNGSDGVAMIDFMSLYLDLWDACGEDDRMVASIIDECVNGDNSEFVLDNNQPIHLVPPGDDGERAVA